MCPAGYYCQTGNATACPAGRYSTIQGSTQLSQCSKCPMGTYQPSTGQQSCMNCPAGSMNNAVVSATHPYMTPSSYDSTAKLIWNNNAASQPGI